MAVSSKLKQIGRHQLLDVTITNQIASACSVALYEVTLG